MQNLTNEENIRHYEAMPVALIENFGEEGDFARQHLLNPAIFRLAGPLAGKTVLDAGCGQGYLARLLAKLVAELVDYAKKNPGKLNYAEASASQRLSGEMFNALAGVKIERVPYKASPQALGDVVSGQVHLMFPDLPQALAQVQAGKVRGLGVTGPQRTKVAPDLPAIAETVKGYSLVYWLAVFAPAATPKAIQQKLFDAIAEAMKDPATVQAMTQGRMEAAVIGLDDFATYVKTETKWWTDQIKAAGIEPE